MTVIETVGLVAVFGVGKQRSVTVMLMTEVPVPVGVPDKRPVDERVSPAGIPVPDQIRLLLATASFEKPDSPLELTAVTA